MNRRELVRVVAAHGDLDAKQVDATLRSLTEVVTAVVPKDCSRLLVGVLSSMPELRP